MRLILIIISVFCTISCKNTITKSNEKNKLSAILAFIDKGVTQRGIDLRIYNPPLPPGKDSVNYKVGVKHDSIIKKLKPLNVFVGDSVVYSSDFITKGKGFGNHEGFNFVKTQAKNKNQAIFLDITSIKKRKGIVLKSIDENVFYKNYKNIYVDDDYGGIISFQNLFVSETGDRAYFEFSHFKSGLNASTVGIFATLINGTWQFDSVLIAIS